MANYQSFQQIEILAANLTDLRDKSKNDPTLLPQFRAYQNYCIPQFKSLIDRKVRKYKGFPNYQDLEQEGYEGLVMALHSYNPDKGSFVYWADYYIALRIARAANAHSVIKIPIHRAKQLKPVKIDKVPVLVDETYSSTDILEKIDDRKRVIKAIRRLPPKMRKLVNLVYGFSQDPVSWRITTEMMSWSKQKCQNMLVQAQEKLKKQLKEI